MMSTSFNREESNFLKGIAICLMLFHHLFLEGRFEEFNVSTWPLKVESVYRIADFCKICVSLFVFISGYGLYLSSQKSKDYNKWILNRWIRTLSGYWFVVIIVWLVSAVAVPQTFKVYFQNGFTYGIFCMLFDFIGFSGFFSMPQFDSSWWYYSAIILYICLTPLIGKLIEKFGSIVTIACVIALPSIGSVFPGWVNFYSFFPIFCFGTVFAKEDLFTRIFNILKKVESSIGNFSVFLISLMVMVFALRVYAVLSVNTFWLIKWNIIPILCILFIRRYFYSGNPTLLKRGIALLGKYSQSIFCLHTVILYTYCKDYILRDSNFIFAYIKLLIMSLIVALIIEKIKNFLKYSELVELISEKIKA